MWAFFKILASKFSQPHHFLLIITALFGLFYWRRLPTAFRWTVACICFNLFIEIAARTFSYLYRNNMPVLHLYAMGAFVMWSLFYRELFGEETFFRRRFYWIVGVVSALLVLNSAVLQPLHQFNTYGSTLMQLIVIWYAIAYAFYLPESMLQPTVEQKMLRVINAAVLIYFCSSLFIFMSGFLVSFGLVHQLTLMNKVFIFLFESLILYALWRVIYHQKRSYSSSVSP